ncbi:hypothetical protein [uncultured Gammaproteobacteria bacterium]|nr:hypothetical protein [uncultured Gammaproteobacteria bacterium]
MICSYSLSVKRKPISSDCFSAFGLGLRQAGLFWLVADFSKLISVFLLFYFPRPLHKYE